MCLKSRGCGSGRMPYENAMKRTYLGATCPWCTTRVYRTNIQVYSRSACLIPAPSYTQNAPMGIDVSRKAVFLRASQISDMRITVTNSSVS